MKGQAFEKEGDYSMNVRTIKAADITQAVKAVFMDLNYHIGSDILNALQTAQQQETSPIAQNVLAQLLENHRIASEEEVPICQDTGMAVLFVEYGEQVVIGDGHFEEAIQEGVRQAYQEGYLRKSVVDDPVFDRVNTKDNTPALIYTDIVPGDKIRILAGCKGFGSENMSAIKMLTPSAGLEGVKQFIMDTVRYAGPNPCPPIVVGVGIGGDFEQCAFLAKKALCRDVAVRTKKPLYAGLEAQMLEAVNRLGIGPQGFGGSVTALAVNIEQAPTHIAGLPVAVNIGCHVTRHAHAEI